MHKHQIHHSEIVARLSSNPTKEQGYALLFFKLYSITFLKAGSAMVFEDSLSFCNEHLTSEQGACNQASDTQDLKAQDQSDLDESLMLFRTQAPNYSHTKKSTQTSSTEGQASSADGQKSSLNSNDANSSSALSTKQDAKDNDHDDHLDDGNDVTDALSDEPTLLISSNKSKPNPEQGSSVVAPDDNSQALDAQFNYDGSNSFYGTHACLDDLEDDDGLEPFDQEAFFKSIIITQLLSDEILRFEPHKDSSAKACFNFDHRPNPYVGSQKSALEFIDKAIAAYQKTSDNLVVDKGREEKFLQLKCIFKHTIEVLNRALNSGTAFTKENVNSLSGTTLACPSLSVAMHLLCDGATMPHRYLPLLQSCDTRELPDYLRYALNDIEFSQVQAFTHVQTMLRRPAYYFENPKDEVAYRNLYKENLLKFIKYGELGNACKLTTIAYISDDDEVRLFELEKPHKKLTSKLLETQRDLMFKEREMLAYQRRRAILIEFGLFDYFNINKNPSLHPKDYRFDRNRHHVVEAPYFDLAVKAKYALYAIEQGKMEPLFVRNDHFSYLNLLIKTYISTHLRSYKRKLTRNKELQVIQDEGFYTLLLGSDLATYVGRYLCFNYDLTKVYNDVAYEKEARPVLLEGHAFVGERNYLQERMDLKLNALSIKEAVTKYTKYELYQALARGIKLRFDAREYDKYNSEYEAKIARNQEHTLFHKDFIEHGRDPRLENTFNDVLREYWAKRGTNSTSPTMPDARDLISNLQTDLRVDSVSIIPDKKGQALVADKTKQQVAPEFIDSFIKDALNSSQQLRHVLRSKLLAYCISMQGSMPKGQKIDPIKAQLLSTGETRIFKKRVMELEFNTAIHLVIDVSSSMARNDCAPPGTSTKEIIDLGTKYYHAIHPYSRTYMACKTGLAIAAALRGLSNIKLEASFYPDHDNSCSIKVLSAKESAVHYAERFYQPERGSTPTDAALYSAIYSLKKLDCQRNIIILITDGQTDKIFSTIDAIKQTRKEGIELYTLGLSYEDDIAMYPKYENLTDIRQLPQALSRLLINIMPS